MLTHTTLTSTFHVLYCLFTYPITCYARVGGGGVWPAYSWCGGQESQGRERTVTYHPSSARNEYMVEVTAEDRPEVLDWCEVEGTVKGMKEL